VGLRAPHFRGSTSISRRDTLLSRTPRHYADRAASGEARREPLISGRTPNKQHRGTMGVRAGREFLANPGPPTMPDEVLQAMHRPAIDIYAGSLIALTDRLLAELRWIFRTKGRTYIYIANGHGAWEAALTNVLSRGDRILVLESGRFAL